MLNFCDPTGYYPTKKSVHILVHRPLRNALVVYMHALLNNTVNKQITLRTNTQVMRKPHLRKNAAARTKRLSFSVWQTFRKFASQNNFRRR